MPGDRLDERLVSETLDRVIVRAASNSPSGKVRVFGEMVSLLLAQNDVPSAEHLEQLWNRMMQRHSISLLCNLHLNLQADS